MVSDLTDLVNNAAFNYPEGAEIMANTLVKKHRTLQQSVLRLLAGVIKKYSELIETQYKTDPRNESAFHWAKQVSEIDSYFPYV